MTSWQYRVVPLQQGCHDWEIQLDNLGREGWELVTIENGYFVMKQPGAANKRELARYWDGED